MTTIFGRIIQGEIPSYKVAEDSNFYAFLDINPLVKGHVLVVPKVEVDYLFDLDDDTLAKMMVFSKKTAKAIERSIPCLRVGALVVGLEVPHAHIHVIPINAESDMNLSNKRLAFSSEEFAQTAQTIAAEFEKL